MVYSHNGILYGDENKWSTVMLSGMGESHNVMLSKEAVSLVCSVHR